MVASTTIAQAYFDNQKLQDALNDKIPADALTLPVPQWFWNLRAATRNLGEPVIQNSVCHALASYARMLLEKRKAKDDIAEEVQAAKDSVDRELAAALEKHVAAADVEKRVLTAETHEQIWRKHAREEAQVAINSEKRVRVVNTAYKEGVVKIHKELERFEERLVKMSGKKSESKPDEAEVEKAKTDLAELKAKAEEAEEKRAVLLEDQLSCLREDHEMLQEEKERVETDLAVSQINCGVLLRDKEKYEKAREKAKKRKAEEVSAAAAAVVQGGEEEEEERVAKKQRGEW